MYRHFKALHDKPYTPLRKKLLYRILKHEQTNGNDKQVFVCRKRREAEEVKAKETTYYEKKKELAKVQQIKAVADREVLKATTGKELLKLTDKELHKFADTLSKSWEGVDKSGRLKNIGNYQEVEKSIDNYFNTCKIPTKSGVALAIGYNYTNALNIYIERAENLTFTGDESQGELDNKLYVLLVGNAIKRALARIEDILQQRLLSNGQAVGAIFTLKNHYGYKDAQDVKQDISLKGIVVNVQYGKKQFTKA